MSKAGEKNGEEGKKEEGGMLTDQFSMIKPFSYSQSIILNVKLYQFTLCPMPQISVHLDARKKDCAIFFRPLKIFYGLKATQNYSLEVEELM